MEYLILNADLISERNLEMDLDLLSFLAVENETKVEQPRQPTVQQKPEPNSTSLTILCSDCGKDFKISEDKKMMVCSGCGKKIDVNTFEQMRLEKIIEAMKKMQNE